jgi:hypothetical protein
VISSQNLNVSSRTLVVIVIIVVNVSSHHHPPKPCILLRHIEHVAPRDLSLFCSRQ